MTSSMEPPCASLSRMRTPLAAGSIDGVVGRPSALHPEHVAAGDVEVPDLDPRPGREDRNDVGARVARVPDAVVVAVGLVGVGDVRTVVQQVAHAVAVAVRGAHVGGQLALVPLHCSAGSQAPVEARQVVAAGWKASGGQATEEPSQLSARSHAPAAGRQTVPAG